MDSLTQITLGAAVGEVVLGKKIGNRALIWGAIGGTIPDLDVIAGAFTTEIQELAYHRGFSHSILFSIIGAIILSWAIDKLYQSRYHKYFATIGWLLFPIGVGFFLNRFEVLPAGLGFSILIFVITAYILYRRYFIRSIVKPVATRQDWLWLCFWSLLTHPILDCFTTYGTQLFQPFSSYRVAFNTISVADPIYTVPFLILVIIASFYHRSNGTRRILVGLGIGLSSAYLIFAAINKQRINAVFEATLEQNNIEYTRYMTSPTILNNILWYCLAETEDGYYHGLYSIFDNKRKVNISFTARNEHLILDHPDDSTIKTLKWFSNDYYGLTQLSEDILQFNDLRFGSIDFGDGQETYIFNFPIHLKEEGYYELAKINGGPPPGDRKKSLQILFERLKGI